MKVYRIRAAVQLVFFLFLLYGTYAGLRLPNFIPVIACHHQDNKGCFLLPLQRFQEGYRIYPQDNMGLPFQGYLVLWGFWAYIRFFLTLALFAVIFNKLWCGWMCPFGTFQDAAGFIRKKFRIRESLLSERARRALSFLKYVSFILFYFTLAMYICGFRMDTSIFCELCPVKPVLNAFYGNFNNLAVETRYNLFYGFLSAAITGLTLTGIFFRGRAFCLACPVSAFLHFFHKISFARIEKNPAACDSCGNCRRVCPTGINEVYTEKKKKDVFKDDCMLCLRCVESCPQDKALAFKYCGRNIFASSARYLARFLKRKKDP